MGASGERSVFVTVGSTEFDALIEAMTAPQMLRALRALGYTKLRVQYGRGKFVPRACGEDDGLFDEMVDCFRFKPSLTHDMQRAGLIISHAGAGSIFEALRMGKNLIVVINDRLMDNHQAELAEEMQALGHSYAATCSNLLDVIQSSVRSRCWRSFYVRSLCSPDRLRALLMVSHNVDKN